MKRIVLFALLVSLALASACPCLAAGKKESEKEEDGPWSASTFRGLKLRSIGPAVASGRIADFAVDPSNRKRYFVAVASGGVWRTDNAGTTWEPVFDGEGSYSIGCIAMDPDNPFVLWVGTGENNAQRSVSYGDGVYKSLDGGESWTNVGLEDSEHIGKILIDPTDSDVVYVAAQGPLWKAGGDRGLYKTADGGETWKRVLEIDEHTGVNDVVMDPRNPDVLIASAHQRRRHVWTLINGGPGSALYKTTDGGENWRKIESGLPSVDLGRIGLAVSPVNPDVLYAIVEAAEDESGFFRSTNRGETWEKRSGYETSSPQYYNEIVCDPSDVDRVFLMDTWAKVTDDGGKAFRRLYRKNKHVDDHAMWIDPKEPDYYLVGCDGGIYESFDAGENWAFKANLPITQFYRVSADDEEPFYHVFGGTQDNATLGGPSRTLKQQGIANEDWYVPVYGDGFKTRVDPEDPNIVYSQYQYGGLMRYDKASGESVGIQPQPGEGDGPLRWNWNAPLIISPHAHTRLYFAAQVLFRSDDRGDTWRAVSGDLSRGIDRNTLKVMGRVWGPDAVAKHHATSNYGNAVSISESPLTEGLLYAGTDDGLIQVSEDGGATWRRIERFPGVPDRTYVTWVEASLHDSGTVFAAFDNRKRGDFAPYLLKSTDRGRTWTSIAGDLPEDETVHAFAQDHVRKDLLFAGREFGLSFSADGGKRWIALTGGLPTIAVRDLDIQRRENDLVAATFGRGIYILDDYSPLRELSEESLEKEAALFGVKDAPVYVPTTPMGLRGKGFQGDGYYVAENPPFGAVFTYYLKKDLETLEERRREEENEAEEEDRTPPYPTLDELRAEADEAAPEVFLVVSDAEGSVVGRLSGCTKKGMHRLSWDLRFPASTPVELNESEVSPFSNRDAGPRTVPGRYEVSLFKREGGEWTRLDGPQSFETVPLNLATLAAEDREAVLAFQRKTAELQRAVWGALEAAGDMKTRIDYLKRAVQETPAADTELLGEITEVEERLRGHLRALRGDEVMSRHHEPQLPSIRGRVARIIEGQWASTSAPTQTQIDAWEAAGKAFAPILDDLWQLAEVDLKSIEDRLEEAGAPWTPGRIPRWSME